MQFDLWENELKKVRLDRAKLTDCPTCGKGQFYFLNARGGQMAMPLCGRDAVQIWPGGETRLDFASLAKRLRSAGDVTVNAYLLRFIAEGYEITVFADARGIVKGTEDPQVARSLYARYIGI